ncbi:fructan beta-fructosidase [Arthrobacter pascens]|nr:fructan beta-fructosidase [Arthrobacter pascens]
MTTLSTLWWIRRITRRNWGDGALQNPPNDNRHYLPVTADMKGEYVRRTDSGSIPSSKRRLNATILAAVVASGCGLPLSAPALAADTSGGASTAPGTAGTSSPYSETYRPQFHFTPAKNWMNDPNGLVYYQGEYHMFFQYNPSGDTWGNMSWGHAVSTDLVHWTELPLAIPQDDKDMIFSGSAVIDKDNTTGFGRPGNPAMVAIYTAADKATGKQSQALAYSTDKGRTFTKYAGNPVLDIGSNNFRDPKVFWYEAGHEWLMSAALSDQHKVAFYSSPDLKTWTHLSDFGPAGATGGAWECPDLFPLPDPANPGKQKWVLMVNISPGGIAGGSGVQYFTGNFDGTTFTSDDKPYIPPAGASVGSFDDGSFDGWQATGAAFGTAPATGNLPGQGGVSGWVGTGLANSFNGGDASTGTLTSPDFAINRSHLNFLAGGGNHPYVPGSVTGNTLPAGTTFADFEGATYGTGWQATGDFTGTGPAAGTLANQQQVSGYQGSQLINTYINGDISTGTISSPSFTVSSKYINLLVGGGDHPWGAANPTSVNLVVDGKVVQTATGQNSESLNTVAWDVSAYQGKTASIQVVDQNSSGWGHILADQVTFADQPVALRATDTSVKLVVDGQVVRSATGHDSETLDWNSWDLSDIQGKTGHVEITDNNTGGWGHVTADQFNLSDTAAQSSVQRAHWADYGKDNYAGVTFNDAPGGKRIMIGWMNNWDYSGSIPTSPWRSAMTVPRELSLQTVDGAPRLAQTSVNQLSQLTTGPSLHKEKMPVPAGSTVLPATGKAMDITASFAAGTASSYGLKVRTGSGQETLIGYENKAGQVYIDRTKSGAAGFSSSFPGVQTAALKATGGAVTLHILVDWSSVEVFTDDGKIVLTDQIFPDPSSQGIEAYSNGGNAVLTSLDVKQMQSAWPSGSPKQ